MGGFQYRECIIEWFRMCMQGVLCGFTQYAVRLCVPRSPLYSDILPDVTTLYLLLSLASSFDETCILFVVRTTLLKAEVMQRFLLLMLYIGT